jgi:hypothetical protein
MASETRNVPNLNRTKLNNYFQAQQIDLPKSRDLQRLRRCFEGASGPYLDEPRYWEGVLIFDFLHLVLDWRVRNIKGILCMRKIPWTCYSRPPFTRLPVPYTAHDGRGKCLGHIIYDRPWKTCLMFNAWGFNLDRRWKVWGIFQGRTRGGKMGGFSTGVLMSE